MGERGVCSVRKYRKKPVVIEAVQLVTDDDFTAAGKWIGESVRYDDEVDEVCLDIDTLEGTMTAHFNDWIIKGVKGEFYSCKPDIFEATYELVVE